MSDASTIRMIERYEERADAPLFLSGFFQTPTRNFHDSEKIEIDVIRDEEEVAIAIQDLSVGARSNEASLYTNKAFVPPIFNEKGAIKAYNQLRRRAGNTPFDDVNIAQQARDEAFDIVGRLERKLRRAIELECAQVLQSGVVTCIDQSGAAVYSIDFDPKSAHFPTVGTTWSTTGAAGAPLADLDALCTVIRRNGKKKPKHLVFGASAWSRFLVNPAVIERMKFTNPNNGLIKIVPEVRGEGASYMGTCMIGQYEMHLWLYDGFYKHQQTGTLTPYLHDEKVIVLSEGARLDLSFGRIPRLKKPVMDFLPERVASESLGLAIDVFSYMTENGQALVVEAGTRALAIPTAIDTFGCLDVTA